MHPAVRGVRNEMMDRFDSSGVHDRGASESWTMADEEYRYTSPFGGPPMDIEVVDVHGTGPAEHLGNDLMGFLTDFRTSQREQRKPASTPTPADASPPGTPASTAVRDGNRFDFNTNHEADNWVDPYAGAATQVGPDWWQASEGKWYPAELHPDRQAPPPAPPAADAAPEPTPAHPTEPDEGSRKRRFSFGR